MYTNTMHDLVVASLAYVLHTPKDYKRVMTKYRIKVNNTRPNHARGLIANLIKAEDPKEVVADTLCKANAIRAGLMLAEQYDNAYFLVEDTDGSYAPVLIEGVEHEYILANVEYVAYEAAKAMLARIKYASTEIYLVPVMAKGLPGTPLRINIKVI